jgi:formylglycine-generating enzyme required for sulfatase activity
MVVVPAGSFTMGSPADEPEREPERRPDTPQWDRLEGPQHLATISKPFAAGKYAVTFAEWDAWVADGGCDAYKLEDGPIFDGPSPPAGWGRGDRPVIWVNWDRAKSYAKWISQKTGKLYRQLSEAEREYVTRAGTTPFWWGTSITPDEANYDGRYIYAGGGHKSEYRHKTVSVKSFQPNPWGLYQVHGNVWEWVEDCWNYNYKGAPADGSAWETGDCDVRVLRGGSWFDSPTFLRSANRKGNANGQAVSFGFRVARTIAPQVP